MRRLLGESAGDRPLTNKGATTQMVNSKPSDLVLGRPPLIEAVAGGHLEVGTLVCVCVCVCFVVVVRVCVRSVVYLEREQ